MSASAKKHPEGGIREMITISFPIVVANACDTVIIFTDRLFMARLGPVLMNASLGGGLSVYMVMTFFLGLTGYATALTAQYLGHGEKHKCPQVITQAILITLIAYPVILMARPLAYGFFELCRISPEQMGPQKEYFGLLVYIVIFSLLKNSLNSFFSGIGRTRIVMVASLVTMALNVVFNYALIFGHFGMPAMGIKGAALGSILASAIGLLVLVAAYLHPSNLSEFRIMESLKFSASVMKKLLRFGYPAGVEMFLNILSFTAMIFVFQSVSPQTATAASIVINWDIVSYVPLIGIEIGVTSLVGRYMGAGKPDIAHRATLSGIRFGLCYSAILLVLYVGMPQSLVLVFKPDQTNEIFNQAIPTAVNMVRLASLYVCAEVIMIALIGALRGAGDTFWAMVLTVTLHWLLVPICFVLLHVFHLPAEIAWIALIGTFFAFLGLVIRRYRKGDWKNIQMV